MCVSLYECHTFECHGDQEKALNPLELDLEVVVRCLLLGTELQTSETAGSTFNHWVISSPSICVSDAVCDSGFSLVMTADPEFLGSEIEMEKGTQTEKNSTKMLRTRRAVPFVWQMCFTQYSQLYDFGVELSQVMFNVLSPKH